MKYTIGTLASLLYHFLFVASLFAEGTLLHFTGNKNDKTLINVVFLSEGYTENQQQDFKDDVSWLAGAMFSEAPYIKYATYFNTWGIFVASKDSGADNPRENVYRDTYFEASYGKDNRSLVTFKNGAAAFDLLAEQIPDYDLACLLVNDTLNGGSGGSVAVVTTNSLAPLALSHEIGHTFPKLADEYETEYVMTPVESYNVTSITDRFKIPWTRWILPETPLPTPEDTAYKNLVGLFEGATAVPADACCIISSSVPSNQTLLYRLHQPFTLQQKLCSPDTTGRRTPPSGLCTYCFRCYWKHPGTTLLKNFLHRG